MARPRRPASALQVRTHRLCRLIKKCIKESYIYINHMGVVVLLSLFDVYPVLISHMRTVESKEQL